MKDVGVVVVFSDDPLGGVSRLIRYCRSWVSCECYFVVNTKKDKVYLINNKKHILSTYDVPGVNNEWEFSGYKCGFDLAREVISDESRYRVTFLNDTLIRHAPFRKCEILALLECGRKKIGTQPILAGFFHHTRFLNRGNDYANTKYFFVENIPFDTVDEAFAIGEVLVSINSVGGYSNNIYTDASYGVFLNSWLNGGQVCNQDVKPWYKAEELNSENSNFFKCKARSIIHEHLFTDRLLARGVEGNCFVKRSKLISLFKYLVGFEY